MPSDGTSPSARGGAAGTWAGYDEPGKAHPLTLPRYDQRHYAGERRFYVIASSYRSGSHLLADLLMRTKRMGIPAEYFNMRNVARPLAWRWGLPTDVGVGIYLDAVVRLRTTANGVFGLKAHGEQVRAVFGSPKVSRVLGASRFVWLRRRDVLAQAISLEIARQTNRWIRLRDHTPQGRERPLGFERTQIDARLADIAASDALWQGVFAANGIAPVVVWYEDLVEDPSAVCAPVFRLLGEEPRPTSLEKSRFVRQDQPEKAQWRERYLAELRL